MLFPGLSGHLVHPVVDVALGGLPFLVPWHPLDDQTDSPVPAPGLDQGSAFTQEVVFRKAKMMSKSKRRGPIPVDVTWEEYQVRIRAKNRKLVGIDEFDLNIPYGSMSALTYHFAIRSPGLLRRVFTTPVLFGVPLPSGANKGHWLLWTFRTDEGDSSSVVLMLDKKEARACQEQLAKCTGLQVIQRVTDQ